MFYVTKVDKNLGYCLVVDTNDWSAEVHSVSNVISFSKNIGIQGVSNGTVEEINWDALFTATNAKAKLAGYAELEFQVKPLALSNGYYMWSCIDVVEVKGYKHGSSNLTRVKIPNFAYKISYNAFGRRSSLSSISIEQLDLGKSLKQVSESAFANNRRLRTVKNLDRPLELGSNCFYKCDLGFITIVPGAKLNSKCFSHSNLKEIKLLEGVQTTNIAYDAFDNSTMEHLYLPSSLVNNKRYLSSLLNRVPQECKIHIPRGLSLEKFHERHHKQLVYY